MTCYFFSLAKKMDNSSSSDAARILNISDTTSDLDRRRTLPGRFPAIKHLAILTGILLPISLLPYVIARRQVSQLKRQVEALTVTSENVRSELRARLASEKVEQRRLRGFVRDVMNDLEELRSQTEQREHARSALEAMLQKDLRSASESLHAVKYVKWAVLSRERNVLILDSDTSRDLQSLRRPLGPTLAEIAAFMHETELSVGLPPQKDRVEGLRQVALGMQQAKVCIFTSRESRNSIWSLKASRALGWVATIVFSCSSDQSGTWGCTSVEAMALMPYSNLIVA